MLREHRYDVIVTVKHVSEVLSAQASILVGDQLMKVNDVEVIQVLVGDSDTNGNRHPIYGDICLL